MTESFIKENFLLQNKTAERLYFDHAKGMPIIDYHNHLAPDVIADNEPFSGINEIWYHYFILIIINFLFEIFVYDSYILI